MNKIKGLLAALSLLTAPLAVAPGLTDPARAAESVIIGDLNSYTKLPAFSVPYKQGWELALDEINADGGVLGAPLVVVSRDDGGAPGEAVTAASELTAREGATVLMGTLLSNVGLAVSDFAQQRNVLFMAAEPLTDALVWEKGAPNTFRLRPGTYSQSLMLAREAAKLPAKRWATIAPNYEYGQSAVAAFKENLLKLRPDVEFVAEQWPALFKIDAGATTQALALAEPDAIFNVTFGGDLVKFVREGSLRGLFENRTVVSLLTGEPEWNAPLKDELPTGWIVTGYPPNKVDSPEHNTFREAYIDKFAEEPRMGSVVGYVTLKALAKAINQAQTTDVEALAESLRGLALDTPFGPIHFRAADHQSTLGTFVGLTAVENGAGTLTDWYYANGNDFLPSEEEAAKLRAAE